MGGNPTSHPAETLVQLVLRARQCVLVQSKEDWRALGSIASRMLFWCGGEIYGCRCEDSEMRFALQVKHQSLGTIAHQIAGAYATRLRTTRQLGGALFRHYHSIPLDDFDFLEYLVFWLHRPADQTPGESADGAVRLSNTIWTADSAYLVPHSLPWIDTDRVLNLLGAGASASDAYRRRKLQPIPPQILELFTRRRKRPVDSPPIVAVASVPKLDVEAIARAVADYCKVGYEDMLGSTRKRSVSRARVIAAVLATRNGATAAAAARLFNRSRSTLIEQVEHYRATQPEIFAEAEILLKATLADAHE
jgi:Bacterial dnaA protein helix-turn-helix